MRIIIDNYIPYIKGVLEKVADVTYLPYKQMTAETVKNADALIVRTRTHCNRELLAGSAVKFIASATIGYDHIDGKYCDQSGIKWTNAPGCNSLSVAQYMATLFCLLQQEKKIKLAEQTIGIVGVGSVGTQVEKLARCFGMKVLINDPPRAQREGNIHFSTLKKVAEQADIITFHTWLSHTGKHPTYHLADTRFFNSLKKKPIIINAARGEIIDSIALKKAIQQGKIGEVILDCWENEPHIDLELLHQCFIATPHIAGYSADGKANAAMQSVRSVSRFFNLGLDNWMPETLPKGLDVDFSEQSQYDFFTKTYDIVADSERLKHSPETFEKQRSNYPFRREPIAYKNNLPKGLMERFPLFF